MGGRVITSIQEGRKNGSVSPAAERKLKLRVRDSL